MTLYSIPLIYNDHFYLFFCGEKTEHPQPLTLEDCIATHVCLRDKPTMISQVVIYHMGDDLTLNAHIVSLTLFFFNPLVIIVLSGWQSQSDTMSVVIPHLFYRQQIQISHAQYCFYEPRYCLIKCPK